ncbi:alpha/beta fold hydrolase [Halegenticoccus soli]|uniref:alpha/beta fold hydrolase n=1 Tax=Halegenticoccus soli TaxID=1985678 RepID=UPI000C6D7227|nr:alpha/beta fold hydrolase [Halegenticoccus soli]
MSFSAGGDAGGRTAGRRSDQASAHPIDASWLDRSAYPFASKCLGLDAGAVHYVDEGPTDEGETLLMLHGNPTWSFLYRHLVGGLSDEHRCVALDYLGFGLSEAPAGFSYRPEDHAAVVREFVETLALADVTLVVQDWGGPIGLSYALDRPENVRALVAMNSFAWPVRDDRHFRAFSWAAGGPVGRVLCERYDFFTRVVMPLAFADRSKLPRAVHEQYRRPFDDPDRRIGTWVFPRCIVDSTPWLAALWEGRGAIADLPALLAWGMEDPAFRPRELRTFEGLFPDADVRRYDGVGHYVQEELGPDLVPPIRSFLDGLD